MLNIGMKNASSLLKSAVTNPRAVPDFFWQKANKKLVYPPFVWLNSRMNLGTNVFEEDWDLLIILDSLRTDALNPFINEYDFLKEDNIDEIWSVGSHSAEWMANTFDQKHNEILQKTACIFSNSYSYHVLEQQLQKGIDGSTEHNRKWKIQMLDEWGDLNIASKDDLGKYVTTWENYAQDDAIYPSPRSVTNHAILTDRNEDFDRILLHYMPPHSPFIGRALNEEEQPYEYNFCREPYDYELSKRTCYHKHPKQLFELYLDNLRWGLNEIDLLLDNMDREKVVITADHGDPLGDYGYLSCVPGSPHPKIKKVPWVTTTATDLQTHEPTIKDEFVEKDSDKRDQIVEKNLKALGYRS